MDMQSFYIAKKWLYRVVLILVVLIVAAGVVELNRLVREITPGTTQAPVLPSVQPPVAGDRTTPGNSQVKKEPENTVNRDNLNKTAKHEFIVEYRLERDRTRSQRIDMLREAVNNPNSAVEIRKEANRELMSVFRTIEKEMELENLIRAEGFKDAVVYLQETEKTVTLTIHSADLTPGDREKLGHLVTRVTGIQRASIEFICKN